MEPTTIQERKAGTNHITKSRNGTGDRRSAPVSKHSIRKPGENVNGKFSQELENLQELREENRALRERYRTATKTAQRKTAQASYWKGQTKLTTDENRTVRAGDVRKAAKELIQGWSSTLKTDEVAAPLQELGNAVARGEAYEQVRAKAMELGLGIIRISDLSERQ